MMKRIFLLLVLIMFVRSLSYCQETSPEIVRAAFAYKFAQYIEWPKEESFSKYIFGIIASDKTFIKSYKDYLSGKKLKGKDLQIVKLNSLEEATNVHVLLIDPENSFNLESILIAVSNRPVLLVSNDAIDKKSVMINMFASNERISFEVNKANILNNNLKIDPRLILLGGTEMDVVSLYKDSQKDLEIEKEKVKDQQKNLNNLYREIEQKKVEIESHKEAIRIQRENINKQEKELDSLTEEVHKQKALINKDELIARQKEQEIRTYEQLIKDKENEIIKRSAIVVSKTKELKELSIEAGNQNKKINDQKKILVQQSLYIKVQQNALYFFIAFLILALILSFFIYRNYKLQKKFNNELAVKNEQIKQSALLLEREKENTLNSIRYAKTIQKAILPSHEEISCNFDLFTLLRPRDIVSGDFFWYHKIDSGNQEDRCLIAAIDCTGHGVPGAFMSMICNTLLNEVVKQKKIYDPGKILNYLDEHIQILLKQNESENTDGMDACFCLIERSRNNNEVKILFAGAKRPLYYITPASEKVTILNGDRKVVGGALSRDSLSFTTHQIILPKGTKIYLTTDGIFDQNNERKLRIGKKNFEKFLLKLIDVPMDDQKIILEKQLNEFMGKAPQRDDIALLGIKL